jgi:nucleoside-diphosphate-sugar epimerase
MNQKIIVSGATGFVGKNLIPYLLATGLNVVLLSRNQTNSRGITYQSIQMEDWNSIHAFVHLAGKAHDLKKVASDEEYYDVNRDLTIDLFDQFLESSCSIFIYVSSVKAARDSINEVLTEEIIPEPLTVYGKSKLAAEQYLLSKELPANKKVYILRPCMIHGPFNKGNLNLLYTFVSKRIPYPLGRFSNLRSFVSIENFCFLIEKLLNTNINSGVYNIADDTPLFTLDLVTLIGDEINKPAMILNIPKRVIKMIAKVGDVFSLPFNTERIDKLTENYVVSNEKIKKALSLKQLPLSSENGMRKTINSFKK